MLFLSCILTVFFASFSSAFADVVDADNSALSVFGSACEDIKANEPNASTRVKATDKACYNAVTSLPQIISIQDSFDEHDFNVVIYNIIDEYLEDLDNAFKEHWIDIYPSSGKKSGAYSWGCYDSYPYLLLNYNDTFDSVSTMGHELGHSMHSYYSKSQNYVDSNYPIFLAEIASTVNEVLINDYMYKNAKTKEEKIFYLTDFLDSVRTTIYRQTMFAEFEMIIHDNEQKGIPLTEEEISNTYYNLKIGRAHV